MNDGQSGKAIANAPDDPGADTLRSMLREFYNRQMIPSITIVWANALCFLAIAVFSGVRFFRTDETKYQIMYAAIFVCCVQFIALIKIFAWQMIHRNSIKRAVDRLEMRISELGRAAKSA